MVVGVQPNERGEHTYRFAESPSPMECRWHCNGHPMFSLLRDHRFFTCHNVVFYSDGNICRACAHTMKRGDVVMPGVDHSMKFPSVKANPCMLRGGVADRKPNCDTHCVSLRDSHNFAPLIFTSLCSGNRYLSPARGLSRSSWRALASLVSRPDLDHNHRFSPHVTVNHHR